MLSLHHNTIFTVHPWLTSSLAAVGPRCAEMNLSRHDVWGHFAPMFHLVDVFAVYAITLVGGRHVTLPAFNPAEVLLAIGECARMPRVQGSGRYQGG